MDRKYSSNGSENNLIGVRDVSDSGQRWANDGTERGNIGNPTGIVYGWERGQRLVRVGSQNGSGIYQRGFGGGSEMSRRGIRNGPGRCGEEPDSCQRTIGGISKNIGGGPERDRGMIGE